MRILIKNILKWFLHEHDYKMNYMITTEKKDVKVGKNGKRRWGYSKWRKIEFHWVCKSCGKKKIEIVQNN